MWGMFTLNRRATIHTDSPMRQTALRLSVFLHMPFILGIASNAVRDCHRIAQAKPPVLHLTRQWRRTRRRWATYQCMNDCKTFARSCGLLSSLASTLASKHRYEYVNVSFAPCQHSYQRTTGGELTRLVIDCPTGCAAINDPRNLMRNDT